MPKTQAFAITLPSDLARMVKAKVASREYGTESEVIVAGLRALQARECGLERWLRTEVVAAYDKLKADPSSGIPIEEARARLGAHLAARNLGEC